MNNNTSPAVAEARKVFDDALPVYQKAVIAYEVHFDEYHHVFSCPRQQEHHNSVVGLDYARKILLDALDNLVRVGLKEGVDLW